jgi:hypothetical protein
MHEVVFPNPIGVSGDDSDEGCMKYSLLLAKKVRYISYQEWVGSVKK